MRADKKRILVIDDEASITRLLKLNLENTGKYLVHTLNSGETALKAALDFHPDLIFLDVIMPGVDGGHLASSLGAHPALKHTPIVFLTAAATKQEVATRSGMIGGLPFLAKPVELAEVLECIQAQLRPDTSPMASGFAATQRHDTPG